MADTEQLKQQQKKERKQLRIKHARQKLNAIQQTSESSSPVKKVGDKITYRNLRTKKKRTGVIKKVERTTAGWRYEMDNSNFVYHSDIEESNNHEGTPELTRKYASATPGQHREIAKYKKRRTQGENVMSFHDHRLSTGLLSAVRNILEGKKTDDVDPEEAKKKFADRKDKDIDNDGDTDSSDKFLHKRRKAIQKSKDKKKGDDDNDESNVGKNGKDGVDIDPEEKSDMKESGGESNVKQGSSDVKGQPGAKAGGRTPKRMADKREGEMTPIKQGSTDTKATADQDLDNAQDTKRTQGSTRTSTPGQSKYVEHADFGVGTYLPGSEQEDEQGNVIAFDAMFEHGIETVTLDDED